jgi:hypothetical protein
MDFYNNNFPIHTRYLKIKTICNESIPSLCIQFLKTLTPPGYGRILRYEYYTGPMKKVCTIFI